MAQAASSGPASGGNTLTINGTVLGNGSDITNVTICGVAAAIQNQTANSVTVVTGRADDGGTGDIKVYSASLGVTTFTNGYTYNPPGAIFGSFMGWSSVSNLPAASAYLASVTVNGRIYVVEGGGGKLPPSTLYVYDPSQPTLGWLTLSNPPNGIFSVTAVSVSGRIYAIGGVVSTVYVYDPAQPVQGWLSVGNLPTASGFFAVASVNGCIYAIEAKVIFGSDYQSKCYVYNPSQPALGWLSLSNPPDGIVPIKAASANGKIYALCETNEGPLGVLPQSTVYVYDPSQPTLGWSTASNLPAALTGLAAVNANSKIYALGGSHSGVYQSTVYVYDPAQPTLGWSSVSNLPVALSGLAAASANGRIYAIGGQPTNSPSYVSTVYEGSFASGVVPPSGPLTGGNTVTINGNNLGNGDVTTVTLCGNPTTILADNSPTQVVVTAGASAVPLTGDILINSTSYGVTVGSNAYTYLLPIITNTMSSDGTQLRLSWPTNYVGWELQAQTNPMGVGIGTNWFPVANSTNSTQLSIPINPTNPSVFYRLHGL